MSTSLTPRVAIRAAYARLALTCAAKVDIRYYLRGILVEPRAEGGAFIVATNGHHLIAIIDNGATCSERVLLAPDARTASLLPKVRSKGDQDAAQLQLVRFDGRDALMVTDPTHGQPLALQVRDATIQEQPPKVAGGAGVQFPDWRRVLPQWDELKPGAVDLLNANLLLGPLKAIAPTAYGGHPVRVWQRSANSAVAVSLPALSEVLLIVMPMRSEERDFASWHDSWRGEAQRKVEAAPAPAAEPVAAPAEPEAVPA